MDIKDTEKFKTDEVKLTRRKFKNKTFTSNATLTGRFKNCQFTECSFENIKGFFLYFEDCHFKDCFINNAIFSHIDLDWTGNTFEHCNIRNTNFEEGMMFNSSFIDTEFYNTSFLGIYPVDEVVFTNCNFSFASFQTIGHNDSYKYKSNDKSIIFDTCHFDNTAFEYSNLTKSTFKDCHLYGASLLNCTVSNTTFKTSKAFEAKNPDSIAANFDLKTIRNSQSVNKNILKKYFSINDNKVFDLAKSLKASPEYNSAFISYSFKDKASVSKIHAYLVSKNVSCFLWEKDAPGGKFLKQIMSSEIKKHERIIFISSSNSLKSAACQYELTQGREKQNLNWSEVFIPVYLDNYLFEVQEFQIKPADKAVEYWKNISELKNINCIDGTRIGSKVHRDKMFSEILQALTKE